MQVIWQTFLEAVNGRACSGDINALQMCPLHARRPYRGHKPGATLRVSLNSITLEPHFLCLHPGCNFRGSAVDVVQKMHALRSFDAAVDMFRPGNRYAHTLAPNIPDNYFRDYAAQSDSIVRTNSFVDQCRTGMHNSVAGVVAKDILETLGCHTVPEELGVYTYKPPSEGSSIVPQDMRPYLTNANYLIYPYTYNSKLNSVRFHKLHTLCDWHEPETYLLTPNDTGVFMEDNISAIDLRETSTAYISLTALGACIVQSKCRTHTFKRLPIVNVTGFPLPLTFRPVKQLVIITFNQSPLDLGVALNFYNNPVLEDNTDIPVRIMDLNVDASAIPNNLYSRLKSGHYHTVTLEEWILNRLRRLETNEGVKAVRKVFERSALSEYKRETLTVKARVSQLSQPLIDSVQAYATTPVPATRLVLANKQIMSITPAGLNAVHPNGSESTLCNFNIEVKTRSQDKDGGIKYKCAITLDGRTFTVGIRSQDLWFAKTLRQTIAHAMALDGQHGYVAVYRIRGYAWDDILERLSQDVPLLINT